MSFIAHLLSYFQASKILQAPGWQTLSRWGSSKLLIVVAIALLGLFYRQQLGETLHDLVHLAVVFLICRTALEAVVAICNHRTAIAAALAAARVPVNGRG